MYDRMRRVRLRFRSAVHRELQRANVQVHRRFHGESVPWRAMSTGRLFPGSPLRGAERVHKRKVQAPLRGRGVRRGRLLRSGYQQMRVQSVLHREPGSPLHAA